MSASVGLNFYLSIAFFQGFQVFFLPILNEFGWSRALTSVAFSLRQLESGLLAPIIGILVDRWGPRTIILLGVIFTGLGLVMMSTINSLLMFYVAFLVASLGASGASHGVSWPVAIANWFHRLQGRALGLSMLGPVLGGPFVIVVALLMESLGWRQTILILGVGVWIVGIPLAFVARPEPKRYGYLPDGDGQLTEGGASEHDVEDTSSGFTIREAVATRDFWVVSAIFGAQWLAINGLFVHLIPLLEDSDYSSPEAAAIIGLVFVLSGIGRLGAGFTADFLDHRLVLSILVASQIVSLLILLSVGSSDYILLGFFSLLFGAGFGGTIPLRPYLLRMLFGARSFGAIQGLAQSVAIITGMLSPVLYGRIFDVTGSYDLAIYGSVGVLVLSLPLIFLLNRRTPSNGKP